MELDITRPFNKLCLFLDGPNCYLILCLAFVDVAPEFRFPCIMIIFTPFSPKHDLCNLIRFSSKY